MAKIAVSPPPTTHIIEIKAIPPVAFAIPGIRKACKGDIIEFDNQTDGPITETPATDKVFDGIDKLKTKCSKTGKKRMFEVDAG